MASKTTGTAHPDFIGALGTDTDAAIGRRFGVSPASVHRFRELHGIPSHRKATKGARIEALLDQGGLSDSEISRRTGVDRAAIRRRREARGLVNEHADLAQDRVQAVLAYKAAMPRAGIRVIAQAVGISKSRVAKILKDNEPETVKVWALYGYEYAADVGKPNAEAQASVTYAMRRDALPFSGWLAQGDEAEIARQIVVAVGSPEHRMASHNS